MAADRACIYCWDDMDAALYVNTSLLCGHTFHKECLDKDLEIKNMTMSTFQCPVCKNTGEQLALAEVHLVPGPCPLLGIADHASLPDTTFDLEADANLADTPAATDSIAANLEAIIEGVTVQTTAESTTALPPPAEGTDTHEAMLRGYIHTLALLPAEEAMDLGDVLSDDGTNYYEEQQQRLAMPMLQYKATEGFEIEGVPAWDAILSDKRVTCLDCGEECKKYRVLSKNQCTFRCNKCSYVHTRLFRNGNKHVIEGTDLQGTDRRQFFKDSHNANSTNQKHLVTQVIRKTERTYKLGGAFKPLSVWTTQGYDGEAIARHSRPEDVMADPMFGLLYRVPELYVGFGGSEGTTETTRDRKRPRKKSPAVNSAGSVLSMLQPPFRDDAGGAAVPDADNAAPDYSCSESSSSSSSSSLSAPKSRKKNGKKTSKKEKKKSKKEIKKAKKEKARMKKQEQTEKLEKKAEEKAIKTAEMEAARDGKREVAAEKKINDKGQTAAGSVCKKLDTVIASIQKTVRSPGAPQVPAVSKAPLKRLLEQLGSMLTEAQKVAEGIEPGASFIIPEGFPIAIDAAKKHQALFVLSSRTYAQPQP